MRAALARRSAAGRGGESGAWAEPPGTGRDVLAGAKTERSPRSRAAMAESRRGSDSISKSSIIGAIRTDKPYGRAALRPLKGRSRVLPDGGRTATSDL